MSLSLVILAAGKGSRFGGDKPLAAVGPNGESLFEYSIRDAVSAGFTHIVFVVNKHQKTSDFSEKLEVYGNNLKIEFVKQSLSAFVDSEELGHITNFRTKPWGTAHAVLVCREFIHNPFVVINADDYYGRENFGIIGNYLLDNLQNPQACALPGYLLKNTLSQSGGVNRGIFTVDEDGYLESIFEATNICSGPELSQPVNEDKGHGAIGQNSLVSMTFWGFHPSVFETIEFEFQAFLNASTDLLNDEFFIPDVVDRAITAGLLNVRVFETSEKWKGLTYAEDVASVREFLTAL